MFKEGKCRTVIGGLRVRSGIGRFFLSKADVPMHEQSWKHLIPQKRGCRESRGRVGLLALALKSRTPP